MLIPVIRQLYLLVHGFVYTGLIISMYNFFSLSSFLTISYRMSLGTGRPIVLRDENSIRHCRVLLNHPMASPTDVRLVSQVELIAQKSMSVWYCHTTVWFMWDGRSPNLRNFGPSEWSS